MKLQGLEVSILKRKGKCYNCSLELPKDTKRIIVGELSNKHSYCLECFKLWVVNLDE